MTDIELKKLKRADLLEMLIDQSKENVNLQQQLNDALDQLQQREIKINKAGSIAEAALQINGLFESAQNSCAQYLDNIERLNGELEKIRAEQEAVSTRILAESQEKAAQLISKTQEKCDQMVAAAEEEAAVYWDEVFQKLGVYHEEHNGPQELLLLLNKLSKQKETIDEN
ncbi:hypothetical protein NVS47_05995 [Dehalobacterium formicoaceticum]|uniref:Uncharacterized protein n=1 Tax=Dehalobacterium formicoaceticum TaxID=51515 RepID=A0ABT1Y2I0_9FIRM|nr:hypothetical protein [Dehalobacterium formicoaceticum]MCR6545069.1 hypothetical protein [Dehalobacterium formicoaceticum]